MPTKTLVASARAAHVVRRAADYGVDVGGPVRVDMKAVKARKDRIVAQSVENLTKWLAGIREPRRRLGPCALQRPARGRGRRPTLRADRIFINVGGRAALPNWHGIGACRC
jgi:pyruvate/2-oxoglutarate dehydrogenase complex dihydrolipoamide dehydrogenase (E3) component